MAVRNGVPDAVLGGLYPFEDKYVQLDDGTSMHYVEQGRAGLRRPTILLLHGNPTWSFLYRNIIPGLAGAGRVVAPDLVGFGRSDHPRDASYHTLERHIANLGEFIAKTRLKRLVIVAQDWGGPIGLGHATTHDDIAGLVLMNTWAFTEREPLRLPLWYKALRSKPLGGLAYRRRNLFVETILPRLVRAPLDEAVLDGYRHPFPNATGRAGPLGITRMVPDKPSHPDWAAMDRIEKALPSLEAPARILWGRHDPAFPLRFAHAFHAALPGAEGPRVLEAGHYLQEDVPHEVVSEVRDFVRHL